MEDAITSEKSMWVDRLVLLLIAVPAPGWEAEFREITRREIERLAIPAAEVEGDE